MTVGKAVEGIADFLLVDNLAVEVQIPLCYGTVAVILLDIVVFARELYVIVVILLNAPYRFG